MPQIPIALWRWLLKHLKLVREPEFCPECGEEFEKYEGWPYAATCSSKCFTKRYRKGEIVDEEEIDLDYPGYDND